MVEPLLPFTRIHDIRSLGAEFFPRLFIIGADNTPYVSGTGTFIGANLVLTAKHNIDEYLKQAETEKIAGQISSRRASVPLWVVQILFHDNDHSYLVWETERSYLCPFSDLALLHVRPYNVEAAEALQQNRIRHIGLDMQVPQVGDRITAYGYTMSKGDGLTDDTGTNHYSVNDVPRVSVGRVVQVFEQRRDRVMLNFPCFQTDTLFDAGMSGGPVLNDAGALCGVVCSGFVRQEADEPYVSFAASIWPIMGSLLKGEGIVPAETWYVFYKLFHERRFSAENLHLVNVDIEASGNVIVAYGDTRLSLIDQARRA